MFLRRREVLGPAAVGADETRKYHLASLILDAIDAPWTASFASPTGRAKHFITDGVFPGVSLIWTMIEFHDCVRLWSCDLDIEFDVCGPVAGPEGGPGGGPLRVRKYEAETQLVKDAMELVLRRL